MKNILSIALIFILIISCSSEGSENFSAKRFPVDNRAEEPAVPNTTAAVLGATELKLLTKQKETISKGFEEGAFGAYTVLDGEGMIAESTTYFRDEEKTEPTMTKIIYKTGSFVNVYWLTDGIIWLAQDDYNHVFFNNKLILSLNNGEPADISDGEKEELNEMIPVAIKILESPAATE